MKDTDKVKERKKEVDGGMRMDMKKVKRNPKLCPKTVSINIRVSKDVSEWLKEKDFSPTGIFNEALKDLKCPHVQ